MERDLTAKARFGRTKFPLPHFRFILDKDDWKTCVRRLCIVGFSVREGGKNIGWGF
jgi:extradiol dioxygenase family protein